MVCRHLLPLFPKWQQSLLWVSKSPQVPQMPRVLVRCLCSNTNSSSRRRGLPLLQRSQRWLLRCLDQQTFQASIFSLERYSLGQNRFCKSTSLPLPRQHLAARFRTVCTPVPAVSRLQLFPVPARWTCMIREHLRHDGTHPLSPPLLRRICSPRMASVQYKQRSLWKLQQDLQ